jgi:rhodanese-related sulfurtransferase
VHVPMDEIPNRVSDQPDVLSPDRQIVVVCKMGGRSAQVTGWLNRNGYRAVNLDGGMLAWATAGRPMTSEDGAPPRVV